MPGTAEPNAALLPNGCYTCCDNITWLVENRETLEETLVNHDEAFQEFDDCLPKYAILKLSTYTWNACTCNSEEASE